jgi:hypothetical protein
MTETVSLPKNQHDALVAALEALVFYADPETYYAIGFFPDPPCGEFMEDFSDDHGDEAPPGFRPGKRARKAVDDLLAAGIDFGSIEVQGGENE